MSVRELRAELANVINAAGMHDQITFVTSRGRRVAAVVSVATAEGATKDSQAADDAATAQLYASNVVLHEDRGGTPSLTMAEIFEDYATDLLREFGRDPTGPWPPPGRSLPRRPAASGTRCCGGRPRWPSSCASGPSRSPGRSCRGPTGPEAGRAVSWGGRGAAQGQARAGADGLRARPGRCWPVVSV